MTRRAKERLFRKKGKHDFYITRERWVELLDEYKEGTFQVTFGNRVEGHVTTWDFGTEEEANNKFDEVKQRYEMSEPPLDESDKLKQLLKPERVVFT